MHLQENTFFDLDLGVRSKEMLPSALYIVTFSGTKFEADTLISFGYAFTRKYII